MGVPVPNIADNDSVATMVGGEAPQPSSSKSKNEATAFDAEDNDVESKETTYTSLIQQYLDVMCMENATFLAERLVAFSQTSHSIYLLALCYYRSGWPKRAQTVLQDCPIATKTPAMQYLLAKCYYDTNQFGPAEEALLGQCRNDYSMAMSSATTSDGARSSKALGGEKPTMHQWILTTTPCPVPNGAVGLELLGKICRKSNRKHLAAVYFRMALQLDPLMFIAYEALCELGCDDEPSEIFGVALPAVTTEEAEEAQNENVQGAENMMNMMAESPAFSVSSAASTDQQTPNNMDGNTLRRFELGTPSTGGGSSYLPKASLFHTGGGRQSTGTTASKASTYKYSAPPSTGGPSSSLRPPIHAGGGGTSAAVPPSSAVFETPNLTPILRHDDEDHNHGNDVKTAGRETASVYSRYGVGSTTNPRVVRRAQDVASRLYYPPSPETSSSSSYVTPRGGAIDRERRGGGNTATSFSVRRSGAAVGFTNPPSSSRFLSGLGGEQSATSSHWRHQKSRTGVGLFSTDESPVAAVASTPMAERSDGDQEPTPTNHTESMSQQRQPRALFPASSKGRGGTSTFMMDHESTIQEDDFGATAATEASGDRNAEGSSKAQNVSNNKGKDVSSVTEILETLCVIGTAYQELCQYNCREALQIFHRLPHEQFHTGWVLHQVGRAYFEMADYQNAKKYLELMQQVEPHRMKGLEVLSTALWHLKKEVELSHLAQRAVDFDRLSPESWCVVGNCFSLQKEHETALTFFRRSIQLDSTFYYSHTLSGHEYVANEDFDKAVACYRDAIRADERHYNAWYGLGAIYYRQEKYDLAEYHFKRALSINRQSSVLHCHLGMAQHANSKAFEALDTLADAFRLDPRNPQARYQRATIYMALDRLEEALEELKVVRDAAPREASVHFAMGRVLKRVGRPEQAMKCFLTALDLDPKENNLIKAAMDKLDEPDIDEEVSAF